MDYITFVEKKDQKQFKKWGEFKILWEFGKKF